MAGGFRSIILVIKLIAPKTDETTAKCNEKLVKSIEGRSRVKLLVKDSFPPPRDLSILGIKPLSPALVDRLFTTEPSRNP